MRTLAFVVLLAGCSVVDEPYPLAWDPLGNPTTSDCRHLEGRYADRGEAHGQVARPSFTRELLGEDSPWEQAESVGIALTPEGATLTIVGKDKPTVVHFAAKEGEFSCERGRLVLRHRQWVASDVLSGRQSVTMRLHASDPFLVAQVRETMTGVLFVVVPMSGESNRWFRFPRLKP